MNRVVSPDKIAWNRLGLSTSIFELLFGDLGLESYSGSEFFVCFHIKNFSDSSGAGFHTEGEFSERVFLAENRNKLRVGSRLISSPLSG